MDNGLITIALAEADDAYGEQSRVAMHEPYRTLLGHFRHETGHYFWDRLVRDRGRLDAAERCFGDDRQDYGKALQAYYDNGAPMGGLRRNVGPLSAHRRHLGDRSGVRLVHPSP